MDTKHNFSRWPWATSSRQHCLRREVGQDLNSLGHKQMVSSCTREGLDWILWRTSSRKGSSTGTDWAAQGSGWFPSLVVFKRLIGIALGVMV